MVLPLSTYAAQLENRRNILAIQNQLNIQQAAISTGVKSQTYSGLNEEVQKLISLKDQKLATEGYIKAIKSSAARMEVYQNTIDQIVSIIGDVKAEYLKNRYTVDTSTVQQGLLRDRAETALREVTRLLNVKYEDRFLFSGNDVDTPQPMVDPGLITGAAGLAGGPLQDIRNLLNGPPAGGSATAIAAVDAYFQSTVPATVANFYQGSFTQTAGTIPIAVHIDRTINVRYGLRGDNAAVRTTLEGLYLIANNFYSAASSADYFAVLDQAFTELQTSEDSWLQLGGTMGVQQQLMDQVETRHESTVNFLTKQIGDLQDADPAEAITRLQSLQATLQSSFQVTATLRTLTLTNFL
jgi:flagellar hook-associated protein 3 FlgL